MFFVVDFAVWPFISNHRWPRAKCVNYCAGVGDAFCRALSQGEGGEEGEH